MTAALEGVSGQQYAPGRTLPPGKTRYPFYRRLVGPPGTIWTGAENVASIGIRSPDRPARSQSLYRLIYPAHHCAQYYMEILLEDFSAKVGRENIFKPKHGNESLHQDSNDNKSVRIVNLPIINLVVKSTMFLHLNIHEYTWKSSDRDNHKQIDHILIDRRWHSSILDEGSSLELTALMVTVWWLKRIGTDWQ
jgi:hypothetical protein